RAGPCRAHARRLSRAEPLERRVKRRVAITGMGVVSPLGNDLPQFVERLLAGDSPAGPITVFDPAALVTRIAAQAYAGRVTADRKIGFAVAAARAAIEDSRINKNSYPAGSGGLSFGIGLELFSMPDMVRLLNGEPDAGKHPLTFLQTPSDLCLHLVSREHG